MWSELTSFYIERKETAVGNLKEHFLGYFYVQEAASMIPALILDPAEGDLVLDMSEDFFRGSDFGATRKLWAEVPMDFLPLGVDTNLFQPAEKKNHDVQAIIFVGGLDRAHYFKGIPVLLRSLEILRKKGLNGLKEKLLKRMVLIPTLPALPE